MTAWPASSQVCQVYIQIHSPPPACWTFCISDLTLYQTLSSQFIKPCTHSPGPVLSYRYPVPRLFIDPAFSDPPSSFHITDHILLYPRATLSYSIACRLISKTPPSQALPSHIPDLGFIPYPIPCPLISSNLLSSQSSDSAHKDMAQPLLSYTLDPAFPPWSLSSQIQDHTLLRSIFQAVSYFRPSVPVSFFQNLHPHS